jgi:Uma2 family endonuclease
MQSRISHGLHPQDETRLRRLLRHSVQRLTPAPSPSHQRVVLRIARLLGDHFRPPAEVFVAPVDVILTPHDVVQPDVVVVAVPTLVSDRGIEGPPLLVVEVLSPTTTAYDRTTKSHRYAALGVAHYWIADPPARAVECYRLAAGAYRLVASARAEEPFSHPDFPALRLPASRLWT